MPNFPNLNKSVKFGFCQSFCLIGFLLVDSGATSIQTAVYKIFTSFAVGCKHTCLTFPAHRDICFVLLDTSFQGCSLSNYSRRRRSDTKGQVMFTGHADMQDPWRTVSQQRAIMSLAGYPKHLRCFLSNMKSSKTLLECTPPGKLSMACSLREKKKCYIKKLLGLLAKNLRI